ncbi:MAG: bacillithiol system redox-active protein YtxJ [Gemmatimonadota bacterium]
MRPLRDESDFEQALRQERAYLFKHSTRCGSSLRALREMSRYEESDGSTPVFLVDVIAERAVSQMIADRLGVRHESPQVVLLSRGSPVWSASHGGVTAAALAEQDEKFAS